jgi:hypothetical protein
MTLACPVCSAPEMACGHTELVYPPISAPTERGTATMTDTKGPIFLAKQRVRPGRGRPGYKGKNIKVVAHPELARELRAAKVSKD